MRRLGVGLPRPKEPLHRNRADVVLPPACPALASTLVYASSKTSTAALLNSSPNKRRRSPSPSAPPSPPRFSPTSFLISTNESSGSEPLLDSTTWHSLLLLSSSPPPADPSTPLLLPPAFVDPSQSPSPVGIPTAPHAPSSLAPSHPSEPDMRTPTQWTLAEIIKRCSTWEEYVRCRPIGYQRLVDSWALLDERIRKRRYKKPRESQQDVFTHVRSYTQHTTCAHPSGRHAPGGSAAAAVRGR